VNARRLRTSALDGSLPVPGNGQGDPRNGTGRQHGPACKEASAVRWTTDKRREDFEAQALVHFDLLYNSAVQMTRNVADAQDLVQETLVKAYRFFDTFQTGTNCKAWLFRIMKNNFINAFRKRSRTPVQVDFSDVEPVLSAKPWREVPAAPWHEVPMESADAAEASLDEIVEDDVKEALDRLPLEFRLVVILSDIEGFSYREIADAMECPVGTVRSRLSRARKSLRKGLHDFAVARGIMRGPDSGNGVPAPCVCSCGLGPAAH